MLFTNVSNKISISRCWKKPPTNMSSVSYENCGIVRYKCTWLQAWLGFSGLGLSTFLYNAVPKVIFHSHLSFSVLSYTHSSLGLVSTSMKLVIPARHGNTQCSVDWVESPEIKVVLPGLGWVVTLWSNVFSQQRDIIASFLCKFLQSGFILHRCFLVTDHKLFKFLWILLLGSSRTQKALYAIPEVFHKNGLLFSIIIIVGHFLHLILRR